MLQDVSLLLSRLVLQFVVQWKEVAARLMWVRVMVKKEFCRSNLKGYNLEKRGA